MAQFPERLLYTLKPPESIGNCSWAKSSSASKILDASADFEHIDFKLVTPDLA